MCGRFVKFAFDPGFGLVECVSCLISLPAADVSFGLVAVCVTLVRLSTHLHLISTTVWRGQLNALVHQSCFKELI